MLAALAVTADRTSSSSGGSGDPGDHLKELMARLADDHDRDAFRGLFEHFGPRIKAFMMKSGADGAFAEDLVQDVMMTVWRKVGLYAPDRGSVSAWVFTIARNARIDRLRHASSRPYDDVDEVNLASDEPDGEARVYDRQRSERVADALAALPDDQRKVMEMAYIRDIPQTSIADELNIPLGTVKSRMRLAYGKLKISLEELQ